MTGTFPTCSCMNFVEVFSTNRRMTVLTCKSHEHTTLNYRLQSGRLFAPAFWWPKATPVSPVHTATYGCWSRVDLTEGKSRLKKDLRYPNFPLGAVQECLLCSSGCLPSEQPFLGLEHLGAENMLSPDCSVLGCDFLGLWQHPSDSSHTEADYCLLPGSPGEVFQIMYNLVLLTGDAIGWTWDLLHANHCTTSLP